MSTATTATLLRLGMAVAVLSTAGVEPAAAQDHLFDEVRLGGLMAADKTDTNDEKGGFVEAMALFDPWGRNEADGLQKLIRPRIHAGATMSTAGEASQIFGGFSWTVDLGDGFFVEGGVGGTLHNGRLRVDGTDGPKLGCALLFHEYAAAGINLDAHWRVIAQIEHSSHANLCGDTNNGLTRGGVLIGYKF
ncbi:lipid A 3-O-deacylase PagL [Ciceribacter lividus]|uniref:Lipid A 3-O-deacylase PagL n=1 Tax=Ciceribacter lividus TaxID=1197950 RepID=A0A6I7HT23_9HYPH|nr:acyloxyacyl hydrolase [Ciceribacter lividus]RCW28560.1 lipid A 3-O-deacylase PagL [Ciceribacter lividus]